MNETNEPIATAVPIEGVASFTGAPTGALAELQGMIDAANGMIAEREVADEPAPYDGPDPAVHLEDFDAAVSSGATSTYRMARAAFRYTDAKQRESVNATRASATDTIRAHWTEGSDTVVTLTRVNDLIRIWATWDALATPLGLGIDPPTSKRKRVVAWKPALSLRVVREFGPLMLRDPDCQGERWEVDAQHETAARALFADALASALTGDAVHHAVAKILDPQYVAPDKKKPTATDEQPATTTTEGAAATVVAGDAPNAPTAVPGSLVSTESRPNLPYDPADNVQAGEYLATSLMACDEPADAFAQMVARVMAHADVSKALGDACKAAAFTLNRHATADTRAAA